jgi:acyl transferase domain-containing protein
MLQEALVAIERLQARLDAAEAARRAPIAIVGAGLRYPGGVESLDDYWRLLEEGRDAVREVPADRWDADAYFSPDREAHGKMVTRKGGFLDRVELFDPQFFGISPREAKSLDPQQRLILETSHEAMESAGIAPNRLAGSATGVFVGISTSEYRQLMLAAGEAASDVYSATGGALNAAAGRVSFTYGFLGPCVALDTACSSSLNAVHLACQSLRNGESDLALAGGVAVIALPDAMVMFSRWGMLSPDGACKTFDASANGFARGEGCAMIALKRLADARADGNPILGLIRGSATNSDGRSSGMTVPSGPAQERMLRSALANAGLGPLDIDYIEAHGTGTPIGDPIEVGALGAVLCEGRDPLRPLRIGSVKTNLGHTEAAAGAAGLLKIIAALRAETLPPQLHFRTPNPGIEWDRLPIQVMSKAEPWPRRETPRRAGVSAFGFSGTNVHVIVEEAPATQSEPEPTSQAPLPVPLSAATPQALAALAGRYARFIADGKCTSVTDLARTLAVGRSHFQHRAALVARDLDSLRVELDALAAGTPNPRTATGIARTGQATRTAFLFTGQGAQYAGMGYHLYQFEQVFRSSIDRSAEILEGRLDRSLLAVLFPAKGEVSPIAETAYTQPALFALEYALAELWRSWGVEPAFVAGHSVGEYVAACVAGVLNHEDALTLVAERGRLMQALPAGGAMAAVLASEAQVAPMLAGREADISIAGSNGPAETAISGSEAALGAVLEALASNGIEARRLAVSHAFHSPLVDPMLDEFERFAGGIAHRTPHLPMASNVTGRLFDGGAGPDAAYWRRHARGTVRFSECVDALAEAGAKVLIEVGPHPVLLGSAARTRPAQDWRMIATLRRGTNDVETALGALAAAYASGAAVDWREVYARRGGRLIAAPTYAFQRQRYWFDTSAAPPAGSGRAAGDYVHPLLGAAQLTPPPTRSYVAEVDAAAPAYLADHMILDRAIFPATAYIEMALAAAGEVLGDVPVTLSNVTIEAPLELAAERAATLHTELSSGREGALAFAVREVPQAAGTTWRTLARCEVARSEGVGAALPSAAEARPHCPEVVDIAAHYAKLKEIGLDYGPAFLGLAALAKGARIATGTAELSERGGDISAYRFHPALLDTAFHAVSSIVPDDGGMRLYLPIGIDRIRWERPAPRRVVVVARLREDSGDGSEIAADLGIETEDGKPVAQIEGLRARASSTEALSRALGISNVKLADMALAWETVTLAPSAPPTAGLLVLGENDGFAGALAAATGSQPVAAHMLERVLAEGPAPTWLVDCTALAHCSESERNAASAAYGRLLSTVRSLMTTAPGTGLCVVTCGAKAVEPGEAPELGAAVLAGLCRSINAESPEMPMLQLDLDRHAATEPQVVLDALAAAASEPELAVRRGSFLAPRLRPAVVRPGPKEGDRQVLRVTERGDLDRLDLATESRRAPGPGEIEIATRAAGLNFRDVLNALGMYPGDPGALGSECAGVITRVGAGVEGMAAGDAVVALAGDSLASHVTVRDTFVLPKPETIGFADAVTLPNTYLTASLCYARAGGLGSVRRVLVHAAAGGVGLAAMRLALRAGVEVFATAGSEEKRAFVRREGATLVLDSRSAGFAEPILEATGGDGVDLVINALSGDSIAAGMGVLRTGGAFVEIGKNNIWTPEEAAARAPHVRYFIADLGEQILDDPTVVRNTLAEVLADVAKGALKALPVQAFPLTDAREAFRFMANARHTGKVVLVPPAAAGSTMPVRPDGAYLVTGGVRGIGLLAAERLAARGAGEIVLLSRSTEGPEAEAAVARVAVHGAKVHAVACDVADVAAIERLWRDHVADVLPLRGILHAAGVLDDAPIGEQTAARFATVADPKIAGALNLLREAERDPLDFVVLFSSASALLGAPGQANYAAANGWLDALAAAGRATGRPVTSIGWGAWGGTGMAARLSDQVRERWERVFGIGVLDPEAALDAMERVVGRGAAYGAVLQFDPALTAAQGTARVRALLGRVGNAAGAATEVAEPAVDIASVIDSGERARLLLDFVTGRVARALGFNAAAIDPDTPLSDLGFDSLMAVQTRNAIHAELRVDMPIRDLLSGATARGIAQKLALILPGTGAPPAFGGAQEEEWEEGLI